ncbi:hypothetical protein HanIR_Chr17g0893351 [Helianthus annuus]|nr:hypothetical protein HanIR_Chr17g0893351 [Helianthus annuus]
MQTTKNNSNPKKRRTHNQLVDVRSGGGGGNRWHVKTVSGGRFQRTIWVVEGGLTMVYVQIDGVEVCGGGGVLVGGAGD